MSDQVDLLDPSIGPCCASCKFFEPSAHGDGTCQRYPPTIMRNVDPSDGASYYYSARPEVEVEDWCGEWKRIDPEFRPYVFDKYGK